MWTSNNWEFILSAFRFTFDGEKTNIETIVRVISGTDMQVSSNVTMAYTWIKTCIVASTFKYHGKTELVDVKIAALAITGWEINYLGISVVVVVGKVTIFFITIATFTWDWVL